MENVSAVVVNYNAGLLLKKCIESLVRCPVVQKIIIVDNASTDGSLDVVANFKSILIIKNSDNLGFSRACNLGLKSTDSAFVLFLNPDCNFEIGAVESILEVLVSNSKIGMAGGVLIDSNGYEQPGSRRFIPTPWRSFVSTLGLHNFASNWHDLLDDFNHHNKPLPSHPIEVEALSGACMLVKRVAINEVGIWDEGYFLHGEDLDWCMRFRQAGWKLMFVPHARIIHHQGACSRSRPIFVEWHKHKGMVRFYLKFFKKQYPGPFMLFVVFGVCVRFIGVASRYLLLRWLELIKIAR